MADPIETLSGDPTLVLPEFEAPPEDPLPLLDRWLQLADERGVREPRALALATADAEGRPSSRIVLLKQLTRRSEKEQRELHRAHAQLLFQEHHDEDAEGTTDRGGRSPA